MPNLSTLEVGQRPEPADLPLRQVLAVGIGNAPEFYDFLTFSLFAILGLGLTPAYAEIGIGARAMGWLGGAVRS